MSRALIVIGAAGLVGMAACGGKKPAVVAPAAAAAAAPAAGAASAAEVVAATAPSMAAPSKPEDVGRCPDVEQDQKTPIPLPPAGSPVILHCIELNFYPGNTEPLVDKFTYLYYVKSAPLTVDYKWLPYDEDSVLADFRRLWDTKFLDNEWVEVIDEPFSNGVKAKHVIFHMEERQRVKIVRYTGSKVVDASKIESKLREKGIEVRTEAFIDQTTIRKVKGAIQELYAAEGYQYADVTVESTPIPGQPKYLDVAFDVTQGPKVQIRRIDFVGAKAFKSSDLESQMKSNKARGMFSFITTSGNYDEAKFDEDAIRVETFYQDNGYINARVGSPQIEILGDSKDRKTRWVRLKIPIDEGERYKIGTITIADNTIVRTEALQNLFTKLKPGEYFSRVVVDKGFDKAKEMYGQVGYMECSPYLEPRPRAVDLVDPAAPPPAPVKKGQKPVPPPAPIVDLVLHINEGKRYFVNRITFLGNTTTRDTVIRRELHVFEGQVFNTEMLKYSIRRLNQLGYFKPLESNDAVKVDKLPGAENLVDISLKFQEQNRNQITFGAGVSQFEGFFGQMSFQTSNFLGRGETLSVSLQQGSQAKNYELGVTEPYLFDRPMTAGVNLFTRQVIYLNQFTQQDTGGTTTVGLPVHPFSRYFVGYSYDRVRVFNINSAYLAPGALAFNPYLADELLLDHNGHRTISKISQSVLLHNTINAPIFPMNGQKHTLGIDVAGIGGDTQFTAFNGESIVYLPFSRRVSLAVRGQAQYIRPYGSTTDLPIFQKIYLGGEYSIRGFDLRSVGPHDPTTNLVTGGNKSLLFNAEFIVAVAGPVRLLGFYDAGEVEDVGQPFRWYDPVQVIQGPPTIGVQLSDPLANSVLLSSLGFINPSKLVTIGQTSGFKTSTGAEVRFFMPVLNVPFRLIMAYDPQRGGVYSTNTGLLQKAFSFRFAVGTTF